MMSPVDRRLLEVGIAESCPLGRGSFELLISSPMTPFMPTIFLILAMIVDIQTT